MKSRIALVMLLVLALAVPAAMLAQQSKAEKEVRAVITQLNQANIKAGADAVEIFEKYLADDFVRIPPNGAVFTKSDVVNANRTAKSGLEAQDVSDIKIRIYGNTAVATGILNSKGLSPLGYGGVLQSRWTRVFVKHGGIWQCVLYQNTPIKQ
jgi:ketosteroid isomerase-like protein